ncbi:hypothetical protein SB784_38030, partial [Burkholderia sp. SIMBA_048]
METAVGTTAAVATTRRPRPRRHREPFGAFYPQTGRDLAAAIFFISYAAFEVPSNLVLARIGASRTLMRIMVLWG